MGSCRVFLGVSAFAFALVCGCGVERSLPASCSDAMLSPGESDVDCGGDCVPCVDGRMCDGADDCEALRCSRGICGIPTCDDGFYNGDETGVDCGGPECAACPNGQGCFAGDDCVSGLCDRRVCVAPTCTDNMLNDQETDLDCGGPECAPCMPGEDCAVGRDCESGVCAGATDPMPNTCAVPRCGDGVTNGDDECDDGMETAFCQLDCRLVACGDAIVSMGEDCDDGAETATCDADCTASMCGDGEWNATAGEACDDGGDSVRCDSDCTAVACGDGYINSTAGETCEEGGVESATCDDDCTAPICGDGNLNATVGEACDDGGDSATCDMDCTASVCGDGYANAAAGEDCDDGTTTDSAVCDRDCTAVTCGDGVFNFAAGETCDDGNTVDGDGCDATCKTELVIVNGDFETGDYTGWTLQEDSSFAANGLFGIARSGDTLQLGDVRFDYFDGVDVELFQDSPLGPITAGGDYFGFNAQNGPENHRLYQDVILPADVTTLHFSLAYDNEGGAFAGDQRIRVNVRALDDSVTETLLETVVGDPITVADLTEYSVNLAAYAGMNVRIDFEFDVQTYYLPVAFDDIYID